MQVAVVVVERPRPYCEGAKVVAAAAVEGVPCSEGGRAVVVVDVAVGEAGQRPPSALASTLHGTGVLPLVATETVVVVVTSSVAAVHGTRSSV